MEYVVQQGCKLECALGDITQQDDVEAVVNAANADLAPGGGVAGAIHKVAGPRLYEEAKQYASIHPGEAVVTYAYDLPNNFVIHCLGLRYGIDKPEAELLASCYEAALVRAEENTVRSIAFPAISTGAFGYPFQEAATIAVKTVRRKASALKVLKTIRFVLFTKEVENVFLQACETECTS